MPSWPMIALSVVLATLYASIFYVVKGRALIELAIFCGVSLFGFATGELAAHALRLNILMVGEVHVIEATLGSIAFIFVARWLKV